MLEYIEEGNQKSDEVIVFLQGWPDNAKVWDCLNWQEELSDKHLVFINFPNTNGNIDKKWGSDFPEIVADLKLTFDSLDIKNKKKLLVGHDWGCFYSYLFDQQYPNYFQQIITMDVSPKFEPSQPKQILFIIAYQVYLIIAFLIGGPIGKWMTHKLVKFMKHKPSYKDKITSAQNYPYYYLWRNAIMHKVRGARKYLSGYKPSVPLSYLYAKDKPFQFQN